MKSSVNKFNKGLIQDVSDINESNEAYNDSMNGSLIYNDNGNYDWVAQDGNKFSFEINPDGGTDSSTYFPIGAVGDNNIKVIFSVNDTDLANIKSEIGIFATDIDGKGTYKTLFNDRTEPVINRLNFRVKNQITSRFLYENDNLIRVYWVDGIEDDSNPPRTFTFKYTAGDRDSVSSYTAVSDSSASMDSQSPFKTGILKYVERISGNLKTGVYQYAYRCITESGYATPWTTPSRRSFLTSDGINGTNWNLYEMEGSGNNTTFGNRIEIEGVDKTYKFIEVCYIFSQTKNIVTETKIFIKKSIGTSELMVFDHKNMSGTPIISELISSSFVGIDKAKTLDIKGSTLYYGNIIESSSIITDTEKEQMLQNVTINPRFRCMRSDEVPNKRQEIPLTHQDPKIGTIRKSLNQTRNIELDVKSDYVNYKGTQVEKEFSGYWRGETYRFGIVVIDKVGIPLFTTHLADFKFPEQYSSDYEWKRLRANGTIDSTSASMPGGAEAWFTTNFESLTGADGDLLWQEDPGTTGLQPISYIRIMGLEISGIDVSGIKDKISGFHIVRAELDKTILAQGMGLPTVNDVGEGVETTRPFPFINQRWQEDSSSPGSYDQLSYGTSGNRDKSFRLRENLIGFYAPDFDFDESLIPVINTGDNLKIIGTTFAQANRSILHTYDTSGTITTSAGENNHRAHFTYYNWRDAPVPVTFVQRNRMKGGQHTITKQYYTKNNYHKASSAPYPRYGQFTTINNSHRLGMGDTKIYSPTSPIVLDTSLHFECKGYPTTASPGTNPEGYASAGDAGGATPTNDGSELRGKEKIITYYETNNFPGGSTSVLGAQDFFDSASNTNGLMGGIVLNYVRPNPSPYGGLDESSLEQTRWFSTNHFQPVDHDYFTGDPSFGAGVYNAIEIFGGDCYLDYFAFLRTYPRYQINDPNTGLIGKLQTDVAHGVVMPYESDFNHTMRQAASADEPTYANVAARPQDTFDNIGDNPKFFKTGLYQDGGVGTTSRGTTELLEEFNINGVLLQSEIIKFFSSEPQDFDLVNKYPVRWRYTNPKIYGQVVDSWRVFSAFDFRDLDGSYGQINSSTFFNDQIYTFQEKAFGRLRAQDRALINTTIGGIATGTGANLDGVDYISSKYGCQHQFSLINSGTSMYWIDVDKRKGMRFAGDGRVSLSDMRGLHTFFKKECAHFDNKDNPAGGYGICGVFDYENNNLYWTFTRDYHKDLNQGDEMIITNEDRIETDVINVYSNNSTVFVNAKASGMIITFIQTIFNDDYRNNASVYYVANKEGAQPVEIKSINASGTSTVIATVNGGEYYEIIRDENTLPWTASKVSFEDITQHKSTVSYNEDLNAFQGFFSFKPTFYIEHKNLFFTQDKDAPGINNDIYVHNINFDLSVFYGQTHKTYVSINVNQDEFSSKVFDSIRFNGNQKSYTNYSRFLFNTEKQYYYYNVQTDTRLKYVEDSVRMPVRTLKQKDRTRGKYINFIFEFKNKLTEIPVKLNNIITNYRTSNRF